MERMIEEEKETRRILSRGQREGERKRRRKGKKEKEVERIEKITMPFSLQTVFFFWRLLVVNSV